MKTIRISKQVSFRPLVLLCFLMMCGVGLVLPSDGNHGLLSPKSLTFLLSSGSIFGYFLFRARYKISDLKLVLFFLLMLGLLFWSFLVGMATEVELASQFDQFKLFLITIVVALSAIFLVQSKAIFPQTIIRFFICANLLYSTVKVVLVFLHIAGIVNIWTLINASGIRFMSMNIYGGVMRMQTSVDIITPFLLYFMLQQRRLHLNFSEKFRAFYLLISTISIFLSFSRFLIAIGFLSFFLYWLTSRLPTLFKTVAILCLLVITLVTGLGMDNVVQIIERRTSHKDVAKSDDVRVKQIEALEEEFYLYPYLGKGLGAYAENYLRDTKIKHSYEVQWVAFLMQFGVCGIILLFVPLFLIMIRFFVGGISPTNVGFFALFLMWLVSGLTNPFLISLTSGIVYSAFYLVKDCQSIVAQEGPTFRDHKLLRS